MSFDLRLAAWFLWMMPLAAALSIRLMAVCRAAVPSSGEPAAAVTASFTRVLISERTALLRSRRFSLVLLRLI